MEYEFHTIGTIELAEELADTFIDCINKFEKGDWKPHWEGRLSEVNFLHFQNGKGINKKIGTQGFMRSVALEAKIFLQGVPKSGKSGFLQKCYKNEYDGFNKNGDMKIRQLNGFTNAMCKTAEKLLKETAESLPDSMIIKSIRSKKESKNAGVETPEEKKRHATICEVLNRPDQAPFREKILKKYNGTCVVTDCTIKSALDAAHIKSVADGGDYTLNNGLLLRADLHRLFDANLMAIDPETSKVHFKDKSEHYNKYDQKTVDISKASRENLTAHWHKFQTT